MGKAYMSPRHPENAWKLSPCSLNNPIPYWARYAEEASSSRKDPSPTTTGSLTMSNQLEYRENGGNAWKNKM